MGEEKELLTEDVDYDNLVVVKPKIEYRILMSSRNLQETEDRLNALAECGWRVVAATDHLIYIERRTFNRINEG